MSRREPVASTWLCTVYLFGHTPGGVTVFVQRTTATEAARQSLAQMMTAYRATDSAMSVVVVMTPWLDGRKVTRTFTVTDGELVEDVKARKEEAAA